MQHRSIQSTSHHYSVVSSKAVIHALPLSRRTQAIPGTGRHSVVGRTTAISTSVQDLYQNTQTPGKEAGVGIDPTEDLTQVAARVLQQGNGIARRVLSDPSLEGNPLEFLKQTEAYWKALKQQKHEPHKSGPMVIKTSSSTVHETLTTNRHDSSSSNNSSSRSPSFGAAPTASSPGSSSRSSSGGFDFDVIMAGGTLGICVALALQQKGYRVAVVERRRVEGRLQEWNSSRHEIQVLVDMELLTQAELEAAVVSEFNPIRVGFKGGTKPLMVNNVLNIGVCPKTLIATMRARFEVLGGVVYEHTAFKSAVVASDGVVVSLLNAAGAPAEVGDTNRPNAMQQQQQPAVGLHSPFGRVGGVDQVPGAAAAAAAAATSAAAGAHHGCGDASSQELIGSTGAHGSSGSSSSGQSSGIRNGSTGSSRYERWHTVAAAAGSSDGARASAPAADSSNGSITTTSSSSSSSSNSNSSVPGVPMHQAGHQLAPGAVAVQGANRRAPSKLTCRLLLDCMGHYSPIVKQLRGRVKPDGMVLVVGGCATGFEPERNTSADLLYSITDAAADMQLFWEAFPAENGAARTTYMFCYSDADHERPSFEQLLDTYFTLLPAYQGLPSLDAIQFKRVLFGGFPCYSSSTPLAPGFDRVLQLGDASASQSPLSFGGFGSLLRHLSRLSGAISHALQADQLSQQDLAWIHPYQPSLSAAWLFQRAMSMRVGHQQQPPPQQQQEACDGASTQGPVRPGKGSHLSECAAVDAAGPGAAGVAEQTAVAAKSDPSAAGSMAGWQSSKSGNPTTATTTTTSSSSSSSKVADAGHTGPAVSKAHWWQQLLLLPANHINALLGANFTVMALLGQRVLKPFLQDTLQLGPLAATMFGMLLVKPLVIARVFVQVGPKVLLGWFRHFAMLSLYTLAYNVLKPFRKASSGYTFQRLLDALKYGSSSDYAYQAAPPVSSSSSSSNGKPQGATTADPEHAQDAAAALPVGVAASSSSRPEHQVATRWHQEEPVANNIVPAVPASWGQTERLQQQHSQPDGAIG